MNELLLLLLAVLCTGAVLATWKLGRSRLYTLTLIFLLLIATVGGKAVVFFGHETNTGNIFYGAVYLASYFMLERYGRRAAFYSVWVGSLGVAFFVLCVFITASLTGSADTTSLNAALSNAFSAVPRVAFASILAYVLSQNLNIRLYLRLKERSCGAHLWWRANISNALSQILDSAVFFSVAFSGVVSPPNLGDIIVTGFAVKVVYMMFAACFLYLNTVEGDELGDGISTLTVR